MLNDLLMFSCIWFDETMFRNDMIKIIFKLNLFSKNYYPLTKFYTHLVLLYFPLPQQEVASIPDQLSDCKYILNFDHVMVLENIDNFC